MKFSIPKPCSASWNKMHPNTQGRFCDLCSKTVVDFSNKSTQEIEQYFKKNSKEKTCGRFRTGQLSKNSLNLGKTFTKLSITSLLMTIPFSSTFAQGRAGFHYHQNNDSIVKVNHLEDSINTKPNETIIEVIIGDVIEDEQYLLKYEKEKADGSIEKPFKYKSTDDKAIYKSGLNDLVSDIKQKVGKGPFPVEERIFVSFVINSLGQWVNPQIISGKNELLINRSLEIINELADWQPACHNDKPVAVKYVIPILFINQNH